MAGILMVRTLCPYCQRPGVVRNGKRRGHGLLLCPTCGRQSRDGGALDGKHFPPSQIGAALEYYYSGQSFRAVARSLEAKYIARRLHISPQTVRRWVKEYTDAAIAAIQGHRVSAGPRWMLCRMPCSSRRVCWLVVDEASGFILGSRVGADVRPEHATAAIEAALASSVSPVTAISYAECYPRGRERVIRLAPRSTPSSAILRIVGALTSAATTVTGIRAPEGEFFTFSLAGFLDNWRRVSCSFNRIKDPGELEQFVKGWAITRNYLERQKELGGRTPGQVVGAAPPFDGWTELVTQHSRNSAKRRQGNRPSCFADDSAPGQARAALTPLR